MIRLRKLNLIPSLFFALIFLMLAVSSVDAVYYGEMGVSTKDTLAFSAFPDTNYGSQVEMSTGYNTGYRRFFVEFNATGATETVDYVYMRFYGRFEQTIAYENYVDFNVYTVDADWNNTDLTWNNMPSLTKIDEINVTVHANSAEFYLFLDITDAWNDFVGTSFTDYYGFCVIMEKVSDYSYFIASTVDCLVPVEYPVIYYSAFELDTDGDPVGSGSSSSSAYDYVEDMTNFAMVFFVLGIPSFVLFVVSKSPMGMMVGLVLGAGAGYTAGLVEFWLMLLIAVAMIALFLVSWRAR